MLFGRINNNNVYNDNLFLRRNILLRREEIFATSRQSQKSPPFHASKEHELTDAFKL